MRIYIFSGIGFSCVLRRSVKHSLPKAFSTEQMKPDSRLLQPVESCSTLDFKQIWHICGTHVSGAAKEASPKNCHSLSKADEHRSKWNQQWAVFRVTHLRHSLTWWLNETKTLSTWLLLLVHFSYGKKPFQCRQVWRASHISNVLCITWTSEILYTNKSAPCKNRLEKLSTLGGRRLLASSAVAMPIRSGIITSL